jgi:hypothetical protein
MIKALSGSSEDEVAAVLPSLGVPRPRLSAAVSSRTPLPGPREASEVVSEVEWV